MEQKINEENIENNLAVCIDSRKVFEIKSIPKSGFFFSNSCHVRTKFVYFLFCLNFDFGFFIKP